MSQYVYKIETRQTHPHQNFETRAFDCPDDVTRLITFPDFRWEDFDRFLNRDPEFTLEYLITSCFYLIPKNSSRSYFEATFPKILHWWIIVERQKERNIYYSVRFNNVANPENFKNIKVSAID